MNTRCVAHIVYATPRLQASKRQQTKQNFVTLPPQFEGGILNKSSRRTGERNQPGTGSNSSEESRGGGKGENWGVSPKLRSSSQLYPGVFFFQENCSDFWATGTSEPRKPHLGYKQILERMNLKEHKLVCHFLNESQTFVNFRRRGSSLSLIS